MAKKKEDSITTVEKKAPVAKRKKRNQPPTEAMKETTVKSKKKEPSPPKTRKGPSLKKYKDGSILSDEIVIIDCETTGLSPDYDRTIEVGAALVSNGRVIDTFAQLMNPGYPIPYFITGLTGITTSMVARQPAPEKVMLQLWKFIGKRPLLAHNASFDQRFIVAEMDRAGISFTNPFLCSVKLSRRLVDKAPSYSLAILADYIGLKYHKSARLHRALDDVLITHELWKHLQKTVIERSGMADHALDLYFDICKKPKKMVASFFETLKAEFA